MKRPNIRTSIGIALPWLMLAGAALLLASQTSRPMLLIETMTPWAEVGMLAMVMTLIIVTGGIDLSVGSIAALSAIVTATLWQDVGWSIWLAAIGGILAGTLAGTVNGLLVMSGLSPLVATLATMAFYRGLAMTISATERTTQFPQVFREWRMLGAVPIQYWLLIGILGLAAVCLHATVFGRWCFAVGDNRVAARFAAVPDKRLDLVLYTCSGLAAALVAQAGIMQHNVAFPDAWQGVELKVIACVVVGGTLITGGAGSILRTLLGLGIIAQLDVGLQLLSMRFRFLTAESRLIVVGVLLILLATCNERLSRRTERKL